MRSQATKAAEHTSKVIMHDPFAMRPFFGYNFGKYMSHWLSMADRPNAQLPKIFHVNWFRENSEGKLLWPGFSENLRVLDWMFKRTEGKVDVLQSAVGYLPRPGALDLQGIDVDMDACQSLDKEFWTREVEQLKKYFSEQVNDDMPEEMTRQLRMLEMRVAKM